MSLVQKGSDQNFKELVVNSEVPVLVDFWAPWCGPCRMVGPVLEQIATDYKDKVKIVKVNVDEEQGIASSMGIRSIPTIALFNKGEVKEVLIGARPKSDFEALLNKVVADA
jgi:thioredoxin 1